jgi:hypothetical protein
MIGVKTFSRSKSHVVFIDKSCTIKVFIDGGKAQTCWARSGIKLRLKQR